MDDSMIFSREIATLALKDDSEDGEDSFAGVLAVTACLLLLA
jgi:hypothetical protein